MPGGLYWLGSMSSNPVAPSAPPSGDPAAVLDAASSAASNTMSYSISSGTQRLLIVGYQEESATVGAPARTVTWGGKTMTQIVTAEADNDPNFLRATLYYLKESDIASASGTTLTAASGGASDSTIHARSFENIDQTTPVGTADSAVAAAATPNPIVDCDITVPTDGAGVAFAGCGNGETATWANVTERTDQLATNTSAGSYADTTASGAKSTDCTWNTQNRAVTLAAPLNGAGGGGGSTQADTYATEVALHSPIAYYKMDEGAGTVMTDSSPTGNDGTYIGSPTLNVSGPFEGATAVTFAAATQWAQAAYDAALDWTSSEDFSIVIWFKLTAWDGGTIIGREGIGAYDDYELRATTNDLLNSRLANAAETLVVDVDSATSTNLDDSSWHMFVRTFDRDGDADDYLDGSSYGTGTTISSYQHELTGSKVLYLARKANAGGDWAGTLCQVSIHDKLLSGANVTSLWTAAGM